VPRLSPIELRPASAASRFDVPAAAPFFADHFPADRCIRPRCWPTRSASWARRWPRRASTSNRAGCAWRASPTTSAQLSPPGQRLELTAELRSVRDGAVAVAVCAAAEGKRVATGVLEYRPVSHP
jgi:hypothetical protein